MSKVFSDIQILLIQARTSPEILRQEQECFLERCRIEPDQLHAINAPVQTAPENVWANYDVVMIGGAGEYSATETYAWTPWLLRFILDVTDRSMPMFGSCWGHQMIARALGGTVRYDRELTEMGCHWVELSENGKQDKLFTPFPHRFKANMGHHDRVVTLPEAAVELAFSDTQSNQAFKIVDKPIYGTQFHSELDAHRERERLYEYREHYPEVGSDEAFQAIIDGLAETTEVDELLHHFLETFVVSH